MEEEKNIGKASEITPKKEENASAQTPAHAVAPNTPQPKKKTNRTWEAFGKSKGSFIINDPKFFL